VSTWQSLGKHQIGAFAATAADFGTMIACVQSGLLQPVAATGVGATMGALLNFTLGRAWIFPKHTGSIRGQAGRYAAVSAASAAWNVLGEDLVQQSAHVQYVVARTLVAVAVSLLWNYPLQRRFVFNEKMPR
jgi:putative flippase GtrA